VNSWKERLRGDILCHEQEESGPEGKPAQFIQLIYGHPSIDDNDDKEQ
jgi:hypothetical protein